MVLIGLVVAGVGLALDKIEERRAARIQQEQALEENRQQREEEAFNELQSYANFQNILSSKVLSDLEAEDTTSPPPRYSYAIREQKSGDVLPSTEDGARYGPYGIGGETKSHVFLPPSIDVGYQASSNRLHGVKGNIISPPSTSCAGYPQQGTSFTTTLIIPQEMNPDGTRCWSRNYASNLLSHGISQDAFFDFLDSFNAFLLSSNILSIINIAPLCFMQSQLDFNKAISIAVQETSSIWRGKQNSLFLNHVNEALFLPNGLLAVVVSAQPDDKSAILDVNVNSALIPNTRSSTSSVNPNGSLRSGSVAPSLFLSSTAPQTRHTNAIKGNASNPISRPSLPTTPKGALSSNTLHSLVTSMSAARELRKDSRKLRRRRQGNSNTRVGKPIPSLRSGSMSSLSLSLSASSVSETSRIGGSGSSTQKIDTHPDGESMMGSSILPGALYLVVLEYSEAK